MTMLIAYDGRENTEKALEYAIRNSVVYGEKLIVLSVVAKGADADLAKVHAYAEAAAEKARKEGADVQSIVESGQPDKVILETAARFGCGTIIVGRSGKTTLDRVIMGSVSNSIVANAKCTVVVVQRRPSAFTRDLMTRSGVGGHPGMYRDGFSTDSIPLPTTSPSTNIPPDIAQAPDAMTSFGSGTAPYVLSAASRMLVHIGPVTMRPSACLGDATTLMPKRCMS